MAIAVNAGCFSSCRKAKRMSLSIRVAVNSSLFAQGLNRIAPRVQRLRTDKTGAAAKHSESEAKVLREAFALLVYWYRSASTGFSLAARRAGSQVATRAAMASNNGATVK